MHQFIQLAWSIRVSHEGQLQMSVAVFGNDRKCKYFVMFLGKDQSMIKDNAFIPGYKLYQYRE